MDILHLIDRLETIVSQGTRVPGLGKTIIDPDQVLDIIDQMRISVPKEMQESRRVLEQREHVLEQAQNEAQLLLNQARTEIEARLDSHEVVRLAKERAQEITDEARRQGAEIQQQANAEAAQQRREADEYAVDVLRRIVSQISSVQGSLERVIDQIGAKS